MYNYNECVLGSKECIRTATTLSVRNQHIIIYIKSRLRAYYPFRRSRHTACVYLYSVRGIPKKTIYTGAYHGYVYVLIGLMSADVIILYIVGCTFFCTMNYSTKYTYILKSPRKK